MAKPYPPLAAFLIAAPLVLATARDSRHPDPTNLCESIGCTAKQIIVADASVDYTVVDPVDSDTESGKCKCVDASCITDQGCNAKLVVEVTQEGGSFSPGCAPDSDSFTCQWTACSGTGDSTQITVYSEPLCQGQVVGTISIEAWCFQCGWHDNSCPQPPER